MNTFKRSLIPAWVFIKFKPPEEGSCWELQPGPCFSSYLSSLNFSGQSTGFVNPALLQRSISLIAKQFACLQHGGNQWPLITGARGHFWTLQQQTGCKLAQLCQNDLFTRPLNYWQVFISSYFIRLYLLYQESMVHFWSILFVLFLRKLIS